MNDSDTTLKGTVPLDRRPREKAMTLGMKALDDAELMAIIFGTGIQGKPVTQLCADILQSYGGHLSKIAATPAREFIKMHKGIGPAKALSLLAGIELGVRAASDALKVSEQPLNSSATAYEYIRHRLYNLDHEEFWVVFQRHNLIPIRDMQVSSGGMSNTVVDPKIILREALFAGASALMLFHNHPSGTLRPSAADEALTRKICDAAKLLDIRVLDHLIISAKGFYSFHDEGKM